jgi:hypothetical protein
VFTLHLTLHNNAAERTQLNNKNNFGVAGLCFCVSFHGLVSEIQKLEIIMKFEVVIMVQTQAMPVDFKGQLKCIAQLPSEEN